MQWTARRATLSAIALGAAAILAACSLAFPSSDLSAGQGGAQSAATASSVASSGGAGSSSNTIGVGAGGQGGVEVGGAGQGGAKAGVGGHGGGCPPGLADCDGNISNGCESELGTPQHCSGCDDVCMPADKSASCVAGKCTVSKCPANHADCNGVAADGCETTLGTATDCGKCGDVCKSPDGAAMCSGGVCKIPACPANHYDCDGIAANGCESPFVNDGTCASCAHHCTGTMTCVSGKVCGCLSNNDCNGGTIGNCDIYGVCSCYDTGSTPCQIGQRCNAIGACDFVP